MRILLVCIGKCENAYIREFVEYYKKLGITNICIFDNNDPDGESFHNVLDDYISDDFVYVIDYRGRKVCQLSAYQEAWDMFRDKYDWIMFFDCDEFLDIYGSLLQEFLDSFKDANIIKVNWKIYGDNELLKNDGRPVRERFTTPLPEHIHIHYNDKEENDHIKSIIKTDSDISWSNAWNPHIPRLGPHTVVYLSNGNLSSRPNSPWEKYDYSRACLHHYVTKTASEFRNKMKRGYADQVNSGNTLNINKFFRYNSYTEEKEKILRGND